MMSSFMSLGIASSNKLVLRNSGRSRLTLCLIAFYTFSLVCCHQFAMAAIRRNNNNKDIVDKTALLEIKSGISNDPFGVMNSWSSNDSVHYCSWHGVTCGRNHQRVEKLDLGSSRLKGKLSPSVGNLSFLTALQIENNSFMGTIPPEIGRLSRLKHLGLHNNFFVGEIPSNLSACSNLIKLGLHYNNLVGRIPPELGSLSMLQVLALWHNHLTGTIPSSLGNLSSLTDLTISENHLVGNIPYSLGPLKIINYLSLYSNNLSGQVPSFIFNLSSLTVLELGDNRLEGTLPLDLGTMLPRLTFFSIPKNSFVGSIHVPLLNSSHLEVLMLDQNNFQGPFPSLWKANNLRELIIYENHFGAGQSSDLDFVASLGNATMLETFEIQENNFSGSFPETLCNFTMLSMLNIHHNNITGKIPSCIQNLGNLEIFDVGENLLFGAIPSGIGKLKKLRIVSMSDNKLSGNIPTSIGNLTQLSILFLSNTNVQGQIPSTLGNCSNLLALNLSTNNLSGRIPPQLFRLSSLAIVFDLSSNYLSGSIPNEIGKLVNIVEMYFSDNKLSGNLPSSLSACLSLQILYMDRNNFHGSIPSEFITMMGLNELDLSRNNLSGKIPKFLGSLKLATLNLSNNNFEGEVPTSGIFSVSTNFSVLGNKGLCGGIPELNLRECFRKTPKRRTNLGRKSIVIIFCSVLGVIFFVVFVSLCTFFYKKKRKAPKSSCDLENTFINLSYQSLQKATNGFSSNNLIGNGTFGDVYKGMLDEDQTIVAIKKFKLEREATFKSFVAECGALQKVRHRNLVKVITACSSIDHQGNDFKALVFEYMENGSLQDWLHPKPLVNEIDAPRKLNIFQRFNIATDIAFALEYLHHRCDTPIVHCDLKPSNVLLDNEMTAHVGDFGLAKFLSTPDNVVPLGNQSSTIGIRGTVGYTPSEYGMGNEVSTHGDVYSFGILLMELFTGRKPVDDMFKDGFNLRRFVKAALPNEVTGILDQCLLTELIGDEDIDTANNALRSSTPTNQSMILAALILVFEISVACTHETPQERLDMTDVATKLSSTKNKLLGIHSRQQRRVFAG